jgi:hypothetical protein
MRRGNGGRLPVPTLREFEQACVSDSEIVACSGLRRGPLAALSMALNNRHTATVCLDELSAVHLVAAVTALFPSAISPNASPALTNKTADGIEVQVGHQSTEN